MDQRNCIKFYVKNEIKCAKIFEMISVQTWIVVERRKKSVKIAYNEPNVYKNHQQPFWQWYDDYPKLFSSLLQYFHRLLTCSGDKDKFCHYQDDRFSINRIYQNLTCVLLIADSPNVTITISNVLPHLI